MSFYYGEMLRLDWGFGNPNRTAALIASLMIACWAFSLLKRGGFWVALGLFSLLGICLVQTFSRGGLLGLVAGSVTLFIFADRPWPKVRVISVGLAIALLACYAFFLSATARYASSWQGDPSVTNRLELWRHVPSMIVDAPQGWGLGHSQDAYAQWYQAPEREERFLNLVSLHFTLLAELNWPGRIAYLLFLALGFVLTWPARELRCLAVPFGVWTTIFVAGIFSHFSTSWLLYVPAVVALLVAVAVRIARQEWPSQTQIFGAFASVLVAVGAIFFAARMSDSPSIQITPGGIIVGDGQPSAWIVLNRSVLGNSYGKALRKFLFVSGHTPALGLTTDLNKVPHGSTVVLCGEISDLSALQSLSPRKLILLNTNLSPSQFTSGTEAQAVFGEFSRSPSRQSWKQDAQIVSGAGDFLPSWPEIVFEHLR